MEILLVIALILAILGAIGALIPTEWSRFGVVLIGVALILTIVSLLF